MLNTVLTLIYKEVLIPPFYRRENVGFENLANMIKVRKLVKVIVRIGTQACLTNFLLMLCIIMPS